MWVAYEGRDQAKPDTSVFGAAIKSVRDGLLSWRASRHPFSSNCNVSTVARALTGTKDAASLYAQFVELQAGDLMVWVGVGGMTQVPWVHLRNRNIRTVYYNAEPLDRCFGARARHVCSMRPTFTSDGQQCVLRTGHVIDPAWVDEVWDYSSHNIEVGRPLSETGPQIRLVPPGALINATLIAHSHRHVSALSFLGSVGGNSSAGTRRNMYVLAKTSHATREPAGASDRHTQRRIFHRPGGKLRQNIPESPPSLRRERAPGAAGDVSAATLSQCRTAGCV